MEMRKIWQDQEDLVLIKDDSGIFDAKKDEAEDV